ncbi:hypothetical protein H1D31_02790 [Alishewanella sp. BS5-314]|uniref:Uncharacterized protein n=2 Tax=Alteromonadaceae TaxID=72275 RepID=H3ZFJ1_9ALTE|nr:hypothetical protein AJE_11069 [Alishewanella jeotgali KCTC 22429]MCT8124966.1 hypothetical protein [Alishewanella sp. BS5-314]OCW98414.1 hypothetical protein A9165_01635 [Alishewanella sp. HH-ZS]
MEPAMKTGINKSLVIATLLTLTAWPLSAHQQRYDPVEQVAQDVVAFTLQRAADELLRVARIDPVYQGYSRHYEIRHAPPRLDDRTRQQLRRLAAEHQRKLASYERELDRELDKLAREYRHDTRKGKGRPHHKEREKFQRKVDRAYDKFAVKVEREHDRFDRQRDRILRDAYAYLPRR